MQTASEAIRRTRASAYVIATAVLLVPLMEIVASAWPYHVHDASWRVGLMSAIAGASTAILLGLFIIYVLGALFDDRPAIWLVAGAGALMAAFCVIAIGALILDVLELRGRVSPDDDGRYKVVSILTLAKICVATLAASVLARSAFRAGGHSRRAMSRHARGPAPLIVGSPAKPERVAPLE